jgi:hypothetical protein
VLTTKSLLTGIRRNRNRTVGVGLCTAVHYVVVPAPSAGRSSFQLQEFASFNFVQCRRLWSGWLIFLTGALFLLFSLYFFFFSAF